MKVDTLMEEKDRTRQSGRIQNELRVSTSSRNQTCRSFTFNINPLGLVSNYHASALHILIVSRHKLTVTKAYNWSSSSTPRPNSNPHFFEPHLGCSSKLPNLPCAQHLQIISPAHKPSGVSIMAQERTFICFPNLPVEIRNLIWKEAANLPRNLDI